MKTTLELLDHAMQLHPERTAAEWCRLIGVNRTALHVAKARARLTPPVAASIAILIGLNANKWFEIATLESEPDSPMKRKLAKTLEAAWQHS